MIGLVAPFFEYEFMARAALGGCALAVAGAPLGVFLILRRMSLVGDAVGHAVLPGAAGAAILSGGSTILMTLGAALTGLLVFATAGIASRALRLPEDAGFAVFYLAALASGVMLASSGGEVDLDRLLFGAALALDNTALILTGVAAAASLVVIRVLFRPLLLDTLDPQFLRTSGDPKWAGPLAQAAFFGLLALTTVASFHALGALMSIGLTILPAIGARFWAKSVIAMMVSACALGCLGVIMGLLTSFYGDAPAGAAIVASLVVIVLLSSLIGPVNSVASRHLRQVALVS